MLMAAVALLLNACATAQSDGKLGGQSWPVTEFGATGSDETNDTAAFQKAIDICHQSGGGVVEVPKGAYYGGTIELKSNVTLSFDDGASYLGTRNIDDYKMDCEMAVEIPSSSTAQIYACDASNIAITGKGVISVRGQLEYFSKETKTGKNRGLRPMNIRFIRCAGIQLTGITLKDSAAWNTHLVDCEDVAIQGVTIASRCNGNNDGIDMDSCRRVLIENCDINVGDDAICPKGTLEHPVEDLMIRNCRVSSHWGCFKTGTSSFGGFRNITITDCYFYDCPGVPIKLLCVDGGIMENVTISNIKMERVSGPIFIRLGARNRSYKSAREMSHRKDDQSESDAANIIRNITLKNIVADLTTEKLESNTIFITGIPNQKVENVTLENITVTYPGGGKAAHCNRVVPEDEARYPEKRNFGVPPSWGLYARHVDGLTVKNLKMALKKDDLRHAVYTDDVTNLQIDGLALSPQKGSAERLKLVDTPNLVIRNIKDLD
ncbi:Polygalacturonase [Pontiella sulfatireligans]|uniref:Polygalacturonase n=1 Tax=Pontiella sulfatireligans TaxID=2750658 RepID=A0A6C2UF40_9BACT|nr:Polygalacturonase [Pontiella sulfatireligans]